jgi:hypothetical protein
MSASEDHGVASRFTAINGRDRPTIVVSMHGTDGNGAPRRSSPDERAKAQSVMPPPLKEKLINNDINIAHAQRGADITVRQGAQKRVHRGWSQIVQEAFQPSNQDRMHDMQEAEEEVR